MFVFMNTYSMQYVNNLLPSLSSMTTEDVMGLKSICPSGDPCVNCSWTTCCPSNIASSSIAMFMQCLSPLAVPVNGKLISREPETLKSMPSTVCMYNGNGTSFKGQKH